MPLQALKIFVLIIKFIAKVMLGLLLMLLTAIAIIHLPSMQKEITNKLSDYLSSKIEAKVNIRGVKFSIMGSVTIEDLTVWDPHQNKIFSGRKIKATSNIFELVKGKLIFDEIHLEGIDGKLIQSKEGLNIQFIIDAFKPAEQPDTTKSPDLNLKFKKIVLENIVFEFTSTVNEISVVANVGRFITEKVEFSTSPTKIAAEEVILDHTIVNTLSTQLVYTDDSSVASENTKALSPDFGTGIVFEIKALELSNNEVSFHRHKVMETQKFDPAHVTLKDIQLSLSDISISDDTLSAGLQSLSVRLPGFTLTNAEADFRLNRKQMVVSGLHVSSGPNELHADLTAPYVLKSAEDTVQAHVDIVSRCQITPKALSYFFSDSVMNQFLQWGPTDLALEGNYAMGTGKIQTLKLKTGNSQVHAEGILHDVLDLSKISWRDMAINASISSEFKSILTPFLQNINVPPDVTLLLKSSGNPKKIFADAKVLTKWGNVKGAGRVTRQVNKIDIDINLVGEKVDLGAWLNQSWIGPMDLSVGANGIIGEDQNIKVNGLISNIDILDQSMRSITFQSGTRKDNSSILISIADPNYRSEITSEISFAGPLVFTNDIQLDDFKLGRLLHTDSTFLISGDTKSKITIDQSSLEGYVQGKGIAFQNQSIEYLWDTLFFRTTISPSNSDIEFFTENVKASVASNFDIRTASEVIETWSQNILRTSGNRIDPMGKRAANFHIEWKNANFIRLLGIDVDEVSTFEVTGEFDEQKKSAMLQGASGKFDGYGISLDTLNTNLEILQNKINATMKVNNLFYDSVQLGNVDFNILTQGDTAITNFVLANDSIMLLGLRTRILPVDSGRFIYPDKLIVFDNDYLTDPKNPVYINRNNVVFDHFQIAHDDMRINVDGDLNYFDVSLTNVDLTPLNFLLSPDTTVINNGILSAEFSYKPDQQLNLKANIDSLILYNSNPLTIDASAVTDENQVPFEFLLSNASNKVDLKGKYFLDNAEVDAALQLEVNNLELIHFLISGAVEELKGALKGKASITGPIQKPAFKGRLQFLDVGLTTVNPNLTFNVRDDVITVDNSSLVFNNFTLYDHQHHPLTINGNITSADYQSFAYDLKINSDQYNLINNPDSAAGKLRGSLVLDSDIKLKGNEKDTNVEAKITIKDATDFTLVTSSDDIELLKADGIIDFIDPALLLDSAAEQSISFYDSLIASLPDFNLNSRVVIEDNAVLRLIINEQSGDYIEASGGANLELGYDRSRNLQLTGSYAITKGIYRLSFYDLVKRNFTFVQGSSINWHGSPEDGDLNLKAVHTVESNSIGLIGNEIGENEKSIYKRSLDYEVGINIGGTIEKPVVTFSLDLPQDDKVSYPVLANKLDRLRQPEYQSELNKQVFGLLVLGGFLPETGADVNSNVVATTALSNSVNSLLATQLNRFASQYIKGVNIDVGIQSFSDYSAPGGKTQTAMDFRVSKSVMNDRLSFEIGGDIDINQDQSGSNTGKNYRGDIAIIYDLTGNGDKQLKLFNNETYDIVYQEIRNTGISVIFVREFSRKEKEKNEIETENREK